MPHHQEERLNVVEIELLDKRRQLVERVQLLQDIAGVVVLAKPALARVRMGGWHVALGGLEILAIAFAVGGAVRDLKGKGEDDGLVDWTNLAIGVALLTEYTFSVAAGHKVWSPTLVTGLTGVVFAFLLPWLERRGLRRRFIRIDDDGVLIRIRRRRTIQLSWSDLASIEDTGRTIRFHRRDGSTRSFNIHRYDNRDEIRTALFSRYSARI